MAALMALASVAPLPTPAAAQGKPPAADNEQPRDQRRERRKSDRETPPGKEQAKPAPAPDAKDKQASPGDDPHASLPPAQRPPKPPQTAAEKAKQLTDLYAQLATAEDEEQAKKFSSAIERLWAYSGSDTVNLLLDRANKAMNGKKEELASKLYDRIVKLAPDYPEAFSQRAYFYFRQNKFDAAVGDLRRVLALDPNHYKALEGLAQIWKETGNKKAALGVMKQLLDVNPFASGAKTAYEELKREVDGQGI